MDLCNIQEIQKLLSHHGFRFSKSMGQNFLIEGWVPREIAAASGADSSCGVLEIGPGIGPLTQQLSHLSGKVVSVELDRALLPVLKETMGGLDNVEIVPGDILKTDISSLVSDKLSGFTPIACANLPYNITTPVLTRLLECGCFSSITVMIQREVAKRICAQPGTSDYGSFSLYCQYHAHCDYLFEVPNTCFLPAPKVTSAVLQMVPRSEKPPEVEDEDAFFQLVKCAFAQRRKTLLNCLSNGYGTLYSKEMLREMVVDCGLREDVRGERLGISEFAALAKKLKR